MNGNVSLTSTSGPSRRRASGDSPLKIRSIVSKLRHMPKTRILGAGLLVALATACGSRGAERTFLAKRIPVARLDSILKAADSVRLPLGAARILSAVAAESGLAARTPHDTMTIGEILTWARAEQARKKQVDAAAAAAERGRQDSPPQLLAAPPAVSIVKKK